MESKRAKELAEAHWNGYVKPLLEAHGMDNTSLEIIEFHYISATVHGHKHGVLDERNGLFRPRIGHHPPAHPYYHKDDLPLSPEEVKAINEAISPPSLCGSCIRQGCPATNSTDCGSYLPQGIGSEPAKSKQWTHEPEAVAISLPACHLDLVDHLRRQMQFSLKTFGPGPRTAGVIDHIRKELKEIEAAPNDLEEWVDLILLALDGAWRAGNSPEQIAAGVEKKQTKNELRTWPDWRTAPVDKAIEHDRSKD